MVLNAVKNAVLLDADGTKSGKIGVFDSSQLSAKVEENILCMMTKVQSSNTLDVFDQVRPLTSMSGQVATQEQQHQVPTRPAVGYKLSLCDGFRATLWYSFSDPCGGCR